MAETRARASLIHALSLVAMAAVALVSPKAAAAQATAPPAVAARAAASHALERRALVAEARADYDAAFDAFAAALGSALGEGLAAGGDDDARAAAFARAEVYVLKLEFAAERTARFADLERVLADMVFSTEGGRRAPNALHARAAFARMQAALARGDRGQAREWAGFLGFIGRFAIAGPFDNERGGGFATPYGPERGIDIAARYAGKAKEVGWLVPVEEAFLGEVDLDAILRPNDECLAYALAYIFGEGETPQPAALRIGSDEGLKVFWNDGEALVRDAYRTRELDQDVVPVVIRPGWNRLLLKVAERRGSWGFSVRITSPEGGRVAVRTATPDPDSPAFDYTPPKPGEPGHGRAQHAVVRGAIDHLEGLARTKQATAHDAFHLGYLAYRSRAHDENEHPDREAFRRAVELAPEDPVYRAYLGFVSAQAGEFSVNREENARRVELERALELAPGHARIAVLLADYYLRSLKNATRAEAYVDRALRANPDAIEALVLKGEILERRGFDVLARGHWRELAEHEAGRRLPDVLARLARVARARGDVAEAERLLRAALARDARHAYARRGLVEILWARGDLDGALAEIETGIGLAPAAVGPRLERARLLEAAGKLVEAEREIRMALEIAPEDDAVLAALGRIALRLGASERALELFGRALALNPKLVDVRKHVDFLREERPFEEDHKLDVETIVAAAKAVPIDPEASARKLLYLVVDKVNRDGTSSEFVQEVVRIENQDGVDGYDAYAVPYAVGEQKATFRRATVIRKDGRREEARIDARGREQASEFTTYSRISVDLPALEIGDIVVLEHRVDDLTQSFFGDYFGKTFYFQDLVPIERTRFVLVVPADRRFYFNRRGIELEPDVRPGPDGKTVAYAWERTGVPRLEAEPDMPPLDEVLPCVQVSTFADWDAFARWYWSLVRKQFEVSEELRAKVEQLVAGASTREAKIRAIYDFVVTDIRYNDKWEFGVHGFKPYNATAIFARRFGDCKDKATLISTMLGVVGIPAYPVLIDGQSRRGREDFTLPLMSHFNHCIAYVPDPAGGEGWFLDGTAQHHEATNLPAMDRGATCLVVRETGGELKRIAWPEPFDQGIRERHRVVLAPGGGATIESELAPTGRFASGIREVFSQPGQRREMLERIYGRELAGAQALDAEFGDLGDLGTPVKVRFRLQVPKLVKTGSRGFALEEVRSVLFRWLYVAKARDLAPKAERRFDVVLPIPSGVEEVVEYTLPEGMTVRETPKPAEVESEFGRYRKVYEVDGRTLRVRRIVEMRAQRVPVEKYEEFRRFAVEVDRADEERAILGEGPTEQ